jgi:hypothetical protein
MSELLEYDIEQTDRLEANSLRSFSVGASANEGKPGPREPGLATGRGGDVTGNAFLFSLCLARRRRSRLSARLVERNPNIRNCLAARPRHFVRHHAGSFGRCIGPAALDFAALRSGLALAA